MNISSKWDRVLYNLEQFLILNGASDYVHYFLRYNYERITNGQITLILAPIDDALQRLVKRAGKQLDVISVLPEGQDILSNFLSSSPLANQYPVYNAINGTTFGKTMNDLLKLKFVSPSTNKLFKLKFVGPVALNLIDIGSIAVGIIDGVITRNAEQMSALIEANIPEYPIQTRISNIIGGDLITNYTDLPNPIIRKIALDLSPADILNSCGINSQFNSSICDSENFWNEKLRRNFPAQQSMINGSWKNTYRAFHKKLYTFGSGRYGQLGHGSIKNELKPRLVEGLNNIVMVACGEVYTALISNGQLYTTGNGSYGQLGHGNTADQWRFKLVEGLNDVTYVSCGNAHTAVISGGRLYTFGIGTSGQLGYGKPHIQPTPRLVEGLDDVTMVACGAAHTTVISNGRLFTFGAGLNGRLGHGSDLDISIPALVEGLDNVTGVACGHNYTAVISNGKLYTFGNGEKGQLGHGNREDIFRPKVVAGLDNVSMVACGSIHTAAISDGRLYTFGGGLEYKLGHGDENPQLKPKLVEKISGAIPLIDVTFVACGDYHTAIIVNEQLYTVGGGRFGRLGQGDEIAIPRFKLVRELVNVIFVACGGDDTAALAD